MESIKLKAGRYGLRRKRDGMGDSGHILKSLKWPEGVEKCTVDDLIDVGENGEIHMGCRIQCGSFYARSYSDQDWWLTTPVTEFINFNEDKTRVEFKTGNSIYIATSF